MKTKYMFWVKICVIVLCIGLAIGILGYLVIYDLNKPAIYKPEIDQADLFANVTQLSSAKSVKTEVQVKQNNFKGIVLFESDNEPKTDWKEIYNDLNNYWPSYNQYYVFEKLDAEVIVSCAEYTPILKAWGYGWLSQNGNLHANYCDCESADDLPNYRNLFRFYVKKGNEEFVFIIYCNTDSPREAFSEVVHYYNSHF